MLSTELGWVVLGDPGSEKIKFYHYYCGYPGGVVVGVVEKVWIMRNS